MESEQLQKLENNPNLYSWLLYFSPVELSVLGNLLAIIIAEGLTLEEKNVIGNLLLQIGQQIVVIAAHGEFMNQVKDLRTQIEQLKTQQNKPTAQEEIDSLKKELASLKAGIQNQIKL